MKKIYSKLLSFLFILTGLNASATVWDINVSNNIFTPGLQNVFVGDTIRWHLLAGSHTTTSVTVPAGAAPWDFTMSSINNLFEYVITEAGQYVYVCSFHGNMSGQLVASPNTGITTPSTDLNFTISKSGSTFNLAYNLGKSSNVDLTVIDVTGKLAKSLVSDFKTGGSYSETYYLSDLKSGIYIIQLVTDNKRVTRRVVIE